MKNQKREKILVKVKSIKRSDEKLIKNLIIAFFLCLTCLVQTIAKAEEGSGEPDFLKKNDLNLVKLVNL